MKLERAQGHQNEFWSVFSITVLKRSCHPRQRGQNSKMHPAEGCKFLLKFKSTGVHKQRSCTYDAWSPDLRNVPYCGGPKVFPSVGTNSSKPGTARHGQVRPGTARHGQVRPGTARYGKNGGGPAQGNLFWWTTTQNLPRMAKSGGPCSGKPVLVDNRTEPSKNGRIRGRPAQGKLFLVDNRTEPAQNGRIRWGPAQGKLFLVDNRTEPSQNGRIRGGLLREACFRGQPHRTLPEWPNQGGPAQGKNLPRMAESGGPCSGEPVLVDNRTEHSQNGRVRAALLRETCFGGQPHRTLPEWPNEGEPCNLCYFFLFFCVCGHPGVCAYHEHVGDLSLWRLMFLQTSSKSVNTSGPRRSNRHFVGYFLGVLRSSRRCAWAWCPSIGCFVVGYILVAADRSHLGYFLQRLQHGRTARENIRTVPAIPCIEVQLPDCGPTRQALPSRSLPSILRHNKGPPQLWAARRRI